MGTRGSLRHMCRGDPKMSVLFQTIWKAQLKIETSVYELQTNIRALRVPTTHDHNRGSRMDAAVGWFGSFVVR